MSHIYDSYSIDSLYNINKYIYIKCPFSCIGNSNLTSTGRYGCRPVGSFIKSTHMYFYFFFLTQILFRTQKGRQRAWSLLG